MQTLRTAMVSLTLLFITTAGFAAPFGDYYPHTRWVDLESHAIQIDAFPRRLVITQRGKRPIIVQGCWRGRSFLRDCRIDYFDVAHEGVDGWVAGDRRFQNFSFRRLRPDPA